MVTDAVDPTCSRAEISRDDLTSTNQSDRSELRRLERLKCFSLKH